jgi:hypothetical protein
MRQLFDDQLNCVSGGEAPPYTKTVIKYVGSDGAQNTIVVFDYAPGSGWATDFYIYSNGKLIDQGECCPN